MLVMMMVLVMMMHIVTDAGPAHPQTSTPISESGPSGGKEISFKEDRGGRSQSTEDPLLCVHSHSGTG
ncbi:hypothetical protein CRUP_016702 [Coryphaenoides rupestris]|nr:hypothetical protein CRUP_016702 [Coryphaenoides rupestris]